MEVIWDQKPTFFPGINSVVKPSTGEIEVNRETTSFINTPAGWTYKP